MNSFITGVDQYLKSGLLPFYYFVVVVLAVLILMKYHSLRLTLFIVLIFWEGLFAYLSISYSSIYYNFYKIIIVGLAFILFHNNFHNTDLKGAKKINIVFFLLSISYWISFLINNQPIITSLSQYGKKILLPYFFIYIIFSKNKTLQLQSRYFNLFRDILLVQIFLSFLKLLLFGFGESIVGSISFVGGGVAAIIPLLGLLLFYSKSNQKLTQNDWMFIWALLVISLASNKRAPVFIMPLLIFGLHVYVKRTRNVISFIKYAPIYMLLIYLGVRTNPSLNQQGSRWGGFDLNYVIQYARDYTFGNEKIRYQNEDIGYGRGGALITIFSKNVYRVPTENIIFGHGITEILKSYDEFDSSKYKLVGKSALSGAYAKIVSLGILGLLLHIIFGIYLISEINDLRLRIVLLVLFLWDLLFYSGVMLGNTVMYVFTIYYIRLTTLIELRNRMS